MKHNPIALPADRALETRFHPLLRIGGTTVLAGALLALVPACSGGGSNTFVPVGTAGAVVAHPEPQLGSHLVRVEPNFGGEGTNLKITGVSWGRLAQVRDQLGTLQQTDFVIGEDIHSDFTDFQLDTNPITEETTVTILHPYTDSAIVGGVETSPYQRALRRLDLNLTPIADRGVKVNDLGPFSLVPRNAAIVIQFNDLIDEATIDRANVKVTVGTPPSTPFEARVVRDINHGAVLDRDNDGHPEFYTTRIIVDTTVSPIESAVATSPLPVNALGLPASANSSQANIGLRIPTRIVESASQFTVVSNLSGKHVSFNGNGNNDSDVATEDVVRGARSGGPTAITGDVNNGFLVDNIPPRLVGTQAVAISSPTPDGLGNYTCQLRFQLDACRAPLKAGDVISQPGAFGELVEPATDAGDGAADGLFTAHFRVIFPLNGQLVPGAGTITSLFDPVGNQGQIACFVRFPTIATPPDAGVATDSSIILRFSEPMDPLRMTPFDNFTLTRVPGIPQPKDYVIGSIIPSSDLKEFRFSPTLPLRHTVGTAEQYFVNLASGASGPVDLAGNPLGAALPQVAFRVQAAEATKNNSGIVLRFDSADEINDTTANAGRSEWRGQFLYDFNQGVLKPRAVVHYSAVADRSQPVPSLMAVFANGVQTPLAPLGSKLQTLWRYCDVGFGLLDETNYNVDVEGLSWAPVGGSAVADSYSQFEMYLTHAKVLPDETVDANLLPQFPNSGLVTTFSQNVLDPVTNPPVKVHDRTRGYVVTPSEVFTSDTGTRMLPYPWNRGVPEAQKQRFTWRDTAVQAKGGANGPGAELAVVIRALGLNPNLQGVPYAAGNVPTVGLPLLMEFRCFPDTAALGLNAFDIAIANLNSAQPNFRAFSTGGTAVGGVITTRNPDLQTSALGGFNPTSTPPGQTTFPADNSFYIGQMNLVTRVSRAHSIWFETGPAGTQPQFVAPVIEPRAEDQPPGTSLVLQYRGATNVVGATVTPTPPIPVSSVANDSSVMDPYGDPLPATPTSVPPFPGGGTVNFLNGEAAPGKWRNSIPEVSNARFFQVRVTFISNLETNLAPTLSALGFPYRL